MLELLLNSSPVQPTLSKFRCRLREGEFLKANQEGRLLYNVEQSNKDVSKLFIYLPKLDSRARRSHAYQTVPRFPSFNVITLYDSCA